MYDLLLTWSNNGMQYYEVIDFGMTLLDCLAAARYENYVADGHAVAFCETST